VTAIVHVQNPETRSPQFQRHDAEVLQPQLREHASVEPHLIPVLREPYLAHAQLPQERAARRRHEAGKEASAATVCDLDPFEREIIE
jgi:hypothetical protein